MREIKFRAWDKLVLEMLYPVWEKDPRGTELYLYKSHNYPGNSSSLSWIIKKDAFVVMQYTGFKDKNGKEIYEGDVLAYHTNGKDTILQPIKFETGSFFAGEVFLFTYYPEEYCKIIGNIYENPELLEEGK